MNESFHIRKAEVRDISDIFRLTKVLAKFENKIERMTSTEQTLHDYLFSSNPKLHGLVLCVKGKVQAHALYYYKVTTFSVRPTLYLEDIVVDPESRSQGYGHALMTELKKVATEHGCKAMEWSVMHWNERAQKFYHMFGAELDRSNIIYSFPIDHNSTQVTSANNITNVYEQGEPHTHHREHSPQDSN